MTETADRTPRLSLDTGYAHQLLTTLRAPHAHGHRCLLRTDTDGREHTEWFNPHAGTRQTCPTWRRLELLATAVDRLSAAVHDAAHSDAHVTAVAEGMTGLVMRDLELEDRQGWMQTARYAIEALAASLDPSAHPAAPEVDLIDWGHVPGGRHRA